MPSFPPVLRVPSAPVLSVHWCQTKPEALPSSQSPPHPIQRHTLSPPRTEAPCAPCENPVNVHPTCRVFGSSKTTGDGGGRGRRQPGQAAAGGGGNEKRRLRGPAASTKGGKGCGQKRGVSGSGWGQPRMVAASRSDVSGRGWRHQGAGASRGSAGWWRQQRGRAEAAGEGGSSGGEQQQRGRAAVRQCGRGERRQLGAAAAGGGGSEGRTQRGAAAAGGGSGSGGRQRQQGGGWRRGGVAVGEGRLRRGAAAAGGGSRGRAVMLGGETRRADSGRCKIVWH